MPVTLPELHPSAAESFAYWGTRAGWLIALSQHRDSDTIERSNWRTIVPAMLRAYPEDAAVESMSNWAVGWTEHLLVRPGTAAAVAAQRWADKLADYPLADEEDYSLLEWAEEWCVRCDRGTREQHADGSLCPKFRSAEDADEITYRWRNRHGNAAY